MLDGDIMIMRTSTYENTRAILSVLFLLCTGAVSVDYIITKCRIALGMLLANRNKPNHCRCLYFCCWSCYSSMVFLFPALLVLSLDGKGAKALRQI